MTTATLEPRTKLPPSQHEFAEVVHRLEAGGGDGAGYPGKSDANCGNLVCLCGADGFLLAGFVVHRRAGVFEPVGISQVFYF